MATSERMGDGGPECRFRFDEAGDFAALNAAFAWCRANGFSYGSLQRDDPVGLMFGDYEIAKWRNLSASDREQLHGLLTGDKRNGPVMIELTPQAHAMLAARSQP